MSDIKHAIELDYAGGANLIYLGLATVGSPTSSAVWQIAKFTYDGNNNFSAMLWANGDSSYTNVWDSRANFSYS